MTRIVTILLAFTLTGMSASGLDAEATAVKTAVTLGDPQQINQALVQLHGALAQHELVDNSSWSNPSPERLQRRHEMMAALEPVKVDLVRLATGEDRTVADNASVILGYSSGGNAVYDALKTNLQLSKRPALAGSALYSLYQLGRADDEVRTAAAERIAVYNERGESQVAFRLLNLAAVWPLPEALPTCIEMLKSDAAVGSKMVAANAIMKLGPAAAEALPELQRFLAQLRAQGGDFRYINTLERAVQVIGGKTDAPSTPVAVTPSPATPVPSATAPASPQPTTPLAQAPTLPAERRAPVWPWVVGGIVALLVIVALALKRRA